MGIAQENMNNPVIVVDADAIIAQANSSDANHTKSLFIGGNLSNLKARLLYPSSVIIEAITVLQGRLDNRIGAQALAVSFTSPHTQIAEINQATISQALKYYSPTASKKHTFFDCIVAAVAKKYKADAIFSFDRFYSKKGFTLVEDLIPRTGRA